MSTSQRSVRSIRASSLRRKRVGTPGGTGKGIEFEAVVLDATPTTPSPSSGEGARSGGGDDGEGGRTYVVGSEIGGSDDEEADTFSYEDVYDLSTVTPLPKRTASKSGLGAATAAEQQQQQKQQKQKQQQKQQSQQGKERKEQKEHQTLVEKGKKRAAEQEQLQQKNQAHAAAAGAARKGEEYESGAARRRKRRKQEAAAAAAAAATTTAGRTEGGKARATADPTTTTAGGSTAAQAGTATAAAAATRPAATATATAATAAATTGTKTPAAASTPSARTPNTRSSGGSTIPTTSKDGRHTTTTTTTTTQRNSSNGEANGGSSAAAAMAKGVRSDVPKEASGSAGGRGGDADEAAAAVVDPRNALTWPNEEEGRKRRGDRSGKPDGAKRTGKAAKSKSVRKVPRYPEVPLEEGSRGKASSIADALRIAVAAEVQGLIRKRGKYPDTKAAVAACADIGKEIIRQASDICDGLDPHPRVDLKEVRRVFSEQSRRQQEQIAKEEELWAIEERKCLSLAERSKQLQANVQAFDERQARGHVPSLTGEAELRALFGSLDRKEEESMKALSDGAENSKRVSDQVLEATNNMFAHAVAIARGLQEMGAEVADAQERKERLAQVFREVCLKDYPNVNDPKAGIAAMLK